MNILFIITSLGVGGAENILTSLSDSLVKKGHVIKIICLRGEVLVKPNSKNIEIVSLKLNDLKNIISIFKSISEIIREYKPDIVHAHMFHAIILARLIRIFTHFPKMISTAHSKSFGGIIRAKLYRATDSLSDINTNVSDEATEFFIKNKIFKRHNTLTVSNGINTEKFKFNTEKREKFRQQFNIESKEKIFIAVGRFNEAKDYPNLLKAFSLYLEQSSSIAKLVIVGDGELRSLVEQLIIQHQLENKVCLLGIRHDVSDLLNMADVFVLSSAWEGFGLVVAEAMATEKIVIATDCGGVKEVLGNEKFLVPTKNSQALAQKMLDAGNLNEQEILEMGRQNRQKIVEQYSSNAMVDHWLEVYNR